MIAVPVRKATCVKTTIVLAYLAGLAVFGGLEEFQEPTAALTYTILKLAH